MGISTWGWGSACGGIVTTWGWGDCPCSDKFIPMLLANYLGDSKAYTCVAKRTYTEIRTRDRPDQILQRNRGWPRQSGEICE